MKFSSETEAAIRAARKAGEAILRIYNGRFDTRFKSDGQPVTDADTDSEKIILEILREKVASIAKGEADLYFTLTNKIKQWDTCAAYCIVTEAGGKMTDMRGQALVYNTEKINHEHGLLVSNGHFTDLPAYQ